MCSLKISNCLQDLFFFPLGEATLLEITECDLMKRGIFGVPVSLNLGASGDNLGFLPSASPGDV